MIQNEIKEKIADFTKVSVSQLMENTLLTDIVPESFVLVEMVIELQEHFGVLLVQEDLKNVTTVGHLVSLLQSKIENRTE